MNKQKKNLKFKKSVNDNSNNTFPTLQNRRNKIKARIIEKYNISDEEAEKVLLKIEKREKEKRKNEIYNNKNVANETRNYQKPTNSNLKKESTSKNVLKRKENADVIIPQHVLDKEKKEKQKKLDKTTEDKQLEINKNQIDNQKTLADSQIPKKVNSKKLNEPINNYKKYESPIKTPKPDKKEETKTPKITPKPDKKEETKLDKEDNALQKDKPQEKNVDSILKDILPNYEQQVSVKVDHVDLTFEVQSEKIETIKEAFIHAVKRGKTKSMKIHALKDVSFEIYKGERVGIIGYNGAGKSTLLNVITGIYPPDKGTVTTYGKISPLLALGAGFDRNFSGRRNIILNGAVLGYDKEYLKSKLDEIIEFSELGEFIDIPIKNYSSGMYAKLGFSIATSVNPDILIIDEILGVGDVNFKKKSADKIRSLMDGGTTVLLVSHSIPQIRELCDKAIWMENGKVRAIGEVNKICDEYLKAAETASNEQLANIELYK